MKLTGFILTIAATVAVVSCGEEYDLQGTASAAQSLVPMTLGASVDDSLNFAVKTTYKSKNIYWEETDAISVFFENGYVSDRQTFDVLERSEDNRSAVFEGLGIPSSRTFTAISPDNPVNAYDGRYITVAIPTEQTGVFNGFDSGSNVAVAHSADRSLLFRNLGSIIAFRFASNADAQKVESVTIRAKAKTSGYIGITGKALVALQRYVPEDVEQYLPITGQGDADHLTVKAPEGKFKASGTGLYYVVVYPFECNGIEITFKEYDGTVRVANKDASGAVKRNQGLFVGTLPALSTLQKK